jgi:hypothetical protein
MKHQIDTMTSINNLVKGYENSIGMLKIRNEQLLIDLEELRKENLLLRTELSEKARKGKKKK